MNVNIPGLLSVIFFYIVILLVGIWAGRKSKSSRAGSQDVTVGEQSQIMLAGRNIGIFVGVFTMTATWVGGGYINGTAEIVYTRGLVWCQAPFGYAISLIIGGQLFAVKMRQAGYKTMLDPFQQHYGARMGGLLFIPALCGEIFWTAAILAALGATVKVILQLDQTHSVIASACIALFYTFTGGLYSVAYTDVVQLAAIFAGLWLCVPFITFNHAVGKISFPFNNYVGSLDWQQFGAYWDSMLLLVMGGVPWQVYFQRVLSSKTAESAELLSYMASFGCIFMAVPPVIIGAAARVANFTAVGYSGRLPLRAEEAALVLPLSLQYLTPPFVSALGLGAVSAAVMSSSDSSILSAASMFAWNIYKLMLRQSASEKEITCVMRLSIILVGVLATYMALTAKSVYGLWYLSSDLVYVILFPQLVSVVHLKRYSNTYGSLAGYIVGITCRTVGGEPTLGIPVILKYPFYSETRGQLFPFRTFSMIASFIALIGVSAAFRAALNNLPRKYDIFRCFADPQPRTPAASEKFVKEFPGSTHRFSPASNVPTSHEDTTSAIRRAEEVSVPDDIVGRSPPDGSRKPWKEKRSKEPVSCRGITLRDEATEGSKRLYQTDEVQKKRGLPSSYSTGSKKKRIRLTP